MRGAHARRSRARASARSCDDHRGTRRRRRGRDRARRAATGRRAGVHDLLHARAALPRQRRGTRALSRRDPSQRRGPRRHGGGRRSRPGRPRGRRAGSASTRARERWRPETCRSRSHSGGTSGRPRSLRRSRSQRGSGVTVFATGGIGGVHRGAERTGDISADLGAIAAHPVVTVCAGAKAFLDLPRTLEHLEMLGVPVVGYGTDTFPGFWMRSTSLPLAHRVDSPREAAAVAPGRVGSRLRRGRARRGAGARGRRAAR